MLRSLRKRIACVNANCYELYMYWELKVEHLILASSKCHGNSPFIKTCLATNTLSIQAYWFKKAY